MRSAPSPPMAPPTSAEPPPDYTHFWSGFLHAVGTKPHDVKTIRGASGIAHRLLAAGIDDEMDRVVLVSADTDARSAALAQADIQAALGSRRVLMARAVLLDVGKVADVIRDATGSPHVTGELVSLMPQTQEEQQELLRPYIEQLTPLFNQWIRNAQGLRGFNLAYALEQGINQLRKLRLVTEADDDGPARLDLAALLDNKSLRDDQDVGICPLALHDFTETEMETVSSGADSDAVKMIFTEHKVMQYFFPAADQLALGLIDRGAAAEDQLVERLLAVPALGHPFGVNEIAPERVEKIVDLVHTLQEMNLATEGEVSLALTPEGSEIRSTVRFQPREGLVSRVLNRFNINILNVNQ